MSPTARSLAFCRAQGWLYAQASWWEHYAKCRKDLCGVIDYVVFDGKGGGVLGVQFTDETSVSKRLDKAKASALLLQWLNAPARFEVWAWGKRGERGARKEWVLRVEEVRAHEIAPDSDNEQPTCSGPSAAVSPRAITKEGAHGL